MCPLFSLPDNHCPSQARRRSLSSALLANTQPHSPFIRKLPVELRLQIYQEAIGRQSAAEILHIGSSRGWPLHSKRCTNAHDPLSNPRCPDRYDRPSGPKALLPLLLTCRLIYAEAIATLYAHHTFDFYPEVFLRFARSVPAPRLAALRSVVLGAFVEVWPEDWEGSFKEMSGWERREWEDVVGYLNGMTGLRSLRVEVEVYGRFADARKAPAHAAMLGILKGLPRVEGGGTVIALYYEKDWSGNGNETEWQLYELDCVD